jgi:ketosteroid isomerase-like protein
MHLTKRSLMALTASAALPVPALATSSPRRKTVTPSEQALIERACERLMAQYCHLVDHGEAARVADLFTEDGVWASSEVTSSGREEIRKVFQARQDRADRMSRHVCTNALIDVVDRDTARGVVYLTLYRHDGAPGRATSPTQPPAMIGEYRDEFKRTTAGWRFHRREFVLSFA